MLRGADRQADLPAARRSGAQAAAAAQGERSDDAPRRRERRLHHRVGDQRRDGRRPAGAHDVGEHRRRRGGRRYRSARRSARRRASDFSATARIRGGAITSTGYEVEGPLQSRSMQVGGLAMHWGGVTPRFSPEDFKQQYAVRRRHRLADHVRRARSVLSGSGRGDGRRGRAGAAQTSTRAASRSRCRRFRSRTTSSSSRSGRRAPASRCGASRRRRTRSRIADGRSAAATTPARRSVPIGAKYSPDFTWNALRNDEQSARSMPRTLVRKLVLDAERQNDLARRSRSIATARTSQSSSRRSCSSSPRATHGARTCCCSRRRAGAQNGVANRSGLVGKYLAGHRNVRRYVDLPLRLYPGMNEQHSLVTKQFMRHKAGQADSFVTTCAIWESSVGKTPRLVDDNGALMLGDAILDDWRQRTKTGTARVRAYYDVIPDRASELTLDATRKNAVGRSAAEARVSRRARVGGAARAARKIRSARCSPTWRARATARCCARRRGQLPGSSGGRLPHGQRSVVERRRFVGTSARSRESVRRRRADVREREAARTRRSRSARWRCARRTRWSKRDLPQESGIERPRCWTANDWPRAVALSHRRRRAARARRR